MMQEGRHRAIFIDAKVTGRGGASFGTKLQITWQERCNHAYPFMHKHKNSCKRQLLCTRLSSGGEVGECSRMR